MNDYQKILLRAATNIISGISMVTLITLGILYVSFSNAFVFQDIKIEITNNPVSQKQDIEFMMIGSKKHECNSTAVYGIAYSDHGESVKLDRFSKQYIRNVHPGEPMPNHWAMILPDDMKLGEYRVSMTGEFICNYLIFQETKSQTFDNILLVVK